jgi:hypothetical protein
MEHFSIIGEAFLRRGLVAWVSRQGKIFSSSKENIWEKVVLL